MTRPSAPELLDLLLDDGTWQSWDAPLGDVFARMLRILRSEAAVHTVADPVG